jgi:predicted dehydrogenase
MEIIRLGVIGLGRMGQRHCRVYSNLRHAQLAAVCDVCPDRAEQTAQQYGVQAFTDVERLLRQVEAVSIATPTASHLELALRCLDHGVHVLVEKPIAENSLQAAQLAQAAGANGAQVQVGHIERFNPAYLELKHVLESTAVLAISVDRLSPYQNSNSDVDVIQDLMIHDLDLMLDLMGQPPESVKACGLSAHEHGVDHAAVHLHYPHGPLVSLTASRVTEHKVRTIHVTGLDAYIECDLLNKSIAAHRSTVGQYLNSSLKGVKYRQESLVERIFVPASEPLFLELQHFVDSIVQGEPALVSAWDGLRALELAETVRAEVNRHNVRYDLNRAAAAGLHAAVLVH